MALFAFCFVFFGGLGLGNKCLLFKMVDSLHASGKGGAESNRAIEEKHEKKMKLAAFRPLYFI